MNKIQKISILLLIVAVAVGTIYAIQRSNDTKDNSQVTNEINETYITERYTFSYPSDFQITEQFGNVYIKDNDAESPFELENGDIWITISPTTQEAYDVRQSPNYASDGPIADSKLIQIQNQFYSVDMIIGGHETATPGGQEVFSLIISSLSAN